MVIAEALVRAIPVITTDIAGIPEMLDDGVDGFVLPEGDEAAFVHALKRCAEEPALRKALGEAGLMRGRRQFAMTVMCTQYAALCRTIAPPTILIDMDGVVVDWDAGFAAKWPHALDRSTSYYMEQCVAPEHYEEAVALFHSERFFRDLPPMAGAVEALRTMRASGRYRCILCTSPILTSRYCAQDKCVLTSCAPLLAGTGSCLTSLTYLVLISMAV